MTTKGMVIDIRSDSSLYVTIGQKTFYIDDSTSEAIMDWWPTDCALNKRRREKQMNIDYNTLPNPMLANPLERYVDCGIEPGSFMMAVLTNNHEEANLRADPDNKKDLDKIFKWVHANLPPESIGSKANVMQWQRERRFEHEEKRLGRPLTKWEKREFDDRA